MRSLSSLWLSLGFLTVVGCKHGPEIRSYARTLEMVLDNGRASERPLTPPSTFEMLLRYDPQLSGYKPLAMRFLLAHSGHLIFTIYENSAQERPGKVLKVIDGEYDPSLISSGKDGKWVLEQLGLPMQKGPIWIGIHAVGGDDPRLWASSNESSAYQRDPDPATPFDSTRIRRTPMVRLDVLPEGADALAEIEAASGGGRAKGLR